VTLNKLSGHLGVINVGGWRPNSVRGRVWKAVLLIKKFVLWRSVEILGKCCY
jgi:hypothetical protein